MFWGDERAVPPDHPDSNYRMTREALLDHVPMRPATCTGSTGESDPAAEAAAYERTLHSVGGAGEGPGLVLLLGLGHDGQRPRCFRAGRPCTSARWVVAGRDRGGRGAHHPDAAA